MDTTEPDLTQTNPDSKIFTTDDMSTLLSIICTFFDTKPVQISMPNSHSILLNLVDSSSDAVRNIAPAQIPQKSEDIVTSTIIEQQTKQLADNIQSILASVHKVGYGSHDRGNLISVKEENEVVTEQNSQEVDQQPSINGGAQDVYTPTKESKAYDIKASKGALSGKVNSSAKAVQRRANSPSNHKKTGEDYDHLRKSREKLHKLSEIYEQNKRERSNEKTSNHKANELSSKKPVQQLHPKSPSNAKTNSQSATKLKNHGSGAKLGVAAQDKQPQNLQQPNQKVNNEKQIPVKEDKSQPILKFKESQQAQQIDQFIGQGQQPLQPDQLQSNSIDNQTQSPPRNFTSEGSSKSSVKEKIIHYKPLTAEKNQKLKHSHEVLIEENFIRQDHRDTIVYKNIPDRQPLDVNNILQDSHVVRSQPKYRSPVPILAISQIYDSRLPDSNNGVTNSDTNIKEQIRPTQLADTSDSEAQREVIDYISDYECSQEITPTYRQHVQQFAFDDETRKASYVSKFRAVIGQSTVEELRNPPEAYKIVDNNKTLDYSYSEDKNEDTYLTDEPVMDGNVKVDFVNGRFEGEIRSGRRNGYGRYYWKDGSVYEVIVDFKLG